MPKTRTSSDKSEAILSAALTLFVERGYHGTAVPAVARLAGVAAGTIYTYFDNKQALVNALYQKWKGAIAQSVVTKFPVTGDPRTQFSTIWKQMFEFAKTHPDAFTFLELHHHASYLDEDSKAVERNLKAFGAQFVERAQSLGALKPMAPMILMELIFGAFNGVFRAANEGRIVLDAETIQATEDACWDAVRAQ